MGVFKMEEKRKVCKIVVNDLDASTKFMDLYDSYKRFGEINMVKLEKRERNDVLFTLAYIGFETPEEADKVMEAKDFVVKGKVVKNSYAKMTPKPMNSYQNRTRLHVSGIGNLQEEELSRLLGKCNLIWPKDSKNAKSPYLFAQYETEEDKKTALDNLNGQKIDDENTLKLSPAYGQRYPGHRRRSTGKKSEA